MDAFTIRLATAADIPILVHQRRSMFRDMDSLSEADQAALVEAYAS